LLNELLLASGVDDLAQTQVVPVTGSGNVFAAHAADLAQGPRSASPTTAARGEGADPATSEVPAFDAEMEPPEVDEIGVMELRRLHCDQTPSDILPWLALGGQEWLPAISPCRLELLKLWRELELGKFLLPVKSADQTRDTH